MKKQKFKIRFTPSGLKEIGIRKFEFNSVPFLKNLSKVIFPPRNQIRLHGAAK